MKIIRDCKEYKIARRLIKSYSRYYLFQIYRIENGVVEPIYKECVLKEGQGSKRYPHLNKN